MIINFYTADGWDSGLASLVVNQWEDEIVVKLEFNDMIFKSGEFYNVTISERTQNERAYIYPMILAGKAAGVIPNNARFDERETMVEMLILHEIVMGLEAALNEYCAENEIKAEIAERGQGCEENGGQDPSEFFHIRVVWFGIISGQVFI